MEQSQSTDGLGDTSAQMQSDIDEERRFLTAWENGLVPVLSGYLRARQIRRAGLLAQGAR